MLHSQVGVEGGGGACMRACVGAALRWGGMHQLRSARARPLHASNPAQLNPPPSERDTSQPNPPPSELCHPFHPTLQARPRSTQPAPLPLTPDPHRPTTPCPPQVHAILAVDPFFNIDTVNSHGSMTRDNDVQLRCKLLAAAAVHLAEQVRHGLCCFPAGRVSSKGCARYRWLHWHTHTRARTHVCPHMLSRAHACPCIDTHMH